MNRLPRRSFLKGALATLAAAAALGFSGLPVRAYRYVTVIGRSQLGQPLLVFHYGEGPVELFILGGHHGGPEYNTTRLTRLLMEHLAVHPEAIPPNVRVSAMPEGNPDGLLLGTRQYASGVDPNRNWDGSNWSSDAYDSNGQHRVGLGGPEPMSEPETQALAGWLLETRPIYIINYHSTGGFMYGGGEGLAGELSTGYAEASGYYRPTRGGNSGGGRRSPLSYRATGHLNGWSRSQGLDGCLIELGSPSEPEFERNLAGLQTVLARLALVT